ncbi:MAG: methylenetetrahydrofolate reductase C-terminal domain-containing protein [Anaerolineae bacterium]|nr:methylenetetrahydrofolate reductase C-terminal domain-containing protein [Anaerolineae bacterium]
MPIFPIFTPARRWQPFFYPFRKPPFSERALIQLERLVKGPLFGCRMCGNCLLQETALICPMECPKGIRNGPCGGSTPERCYVDPTRQCVWYKIYERAEAMGRAEKLLEVLPPLDWEKVGGETWMDVIHQVQDYGVGRFVKGMFGSDKAKRAENWQAIFEPVRQPDWWQGDDKYHPPAYEEPVSNLERALRSGKFIVTSEVAPPMSTATGALRRNINLIKPYVTAINFTDNPSATPRMSSLACSLVCIEEGAEPVMQIAARDRTRMGLQAEVIGATALGVRNILCLSGDHSKLGPDPKGRMDIVDIDSVQMLWILRRMRDEGRYLDGRPIKFAPQMFLGAAGNPFAALPRFQAIRENKKVNAGAQFLQTNLVYDIEGFKKYLELLAERDFVDKVYLLAGVTPLKNLRVAKYMHEQVPGVAIPDRLMARMEKASAQGKGAEEEEGVQIALELIDAIKGLANVSGIHLMAVGWEEIVPRLVTEAGLALESAPKPEAV